MSRLSKAELMERLLPQGPQQLRQIALAELLGQRAGALRYEATRKRMEAAKKR